MGRKKKIINNTGFPNYMIEAFARAIWPAILADYKNPDVQKEYQEWLYSDEYYEDMKIPKPKIKTA